MQELKVDEAAPLFIAAQHGYAAIVEQLITTRCKVNLALKNVLTAISIATHKRHTRVVTMTQNCLTCPNKDYFHAAGGAGKPFLGGLLLPRHHGHSLLSPSWASRGPRPKLASRGPRPSKLVKLELCDNPVLSRNSMCSMLTCIEFVESVVISTTHQSISTKHQFQHRVLPLFTRGSNYLCSKPEFDLAVVRFRR